jgi:hypothetical protein
MADIGAKDVETVFPQCFRSLESGDSLSSSIKGCDYAVPVYREDAVMNTVEDDFAKFLVQIPTSSIITATSGARSVPNQQCLQSRRE